MTPHFLYTFSNINYFVQELQSEVAGLEDTRDELLEHADFVVSLLKPHSKEAAEETDRSVKELVEAYEK